MVMSEYNGFDIFHAGVANFDCVAVKDLMKRVGRREMFINQLKEISTDVSSNCFAEGWIKPNDVSTTSSVGRCQTGGIITSRVLQSDIVVAALKRIFVRCCSRIKGCLIRKKRGDAFVD
jgi:hypothetical protein